MKTLPLFALIIVGLTGCGLKYNFQMSNVLSLDGVKLIDSSISDTKDPRTLLQESYEVNNERRILMRYESILKEIGNINIEDDKRIWMRATLDSQRDISDALGNMKLCFLKKRWTIHATWQWSVPMFGEKWDAAGGDFNPKECVMPVTADGAKKVDSSFKDDKDSMPHLYFDVTRWYVNNARGRKRNDGFILLTDFASPRNPIKLYGDSSSNYSPRLLCRMGG